MARLVKSLFMFGLNDRGWSESYYFQDTSQRPLNVLNDLAAQVATKRAQLLGAQAYIKAIRTSIEWDDAGVPVLGDSYLTYPDLRPSVAYDTDEPDAAVQVIWRDLISGRTKRMYMRGIFDGVDVRGGQIDPNYGQFQTKFLDWVAITIQRGMGWVSEIPDQAGTIVGYTSLASGQIQFTTLLPFFPPTQVGADQMVRVSKLNGKSVLNGAVLVRADAVNKFTTNKAIGAGPYQYGGKVTRYRKEFKAATNIEYQKIVSRKTGAPLLVSRGRLPVRPRI